MDSDKTKKINRRTFLKGAASTAIAGSAAVTAGCKAKGLLDSSESYALEFQEYFKKHYRLMTQEEREKTVARLEKLAKLKQDININVDTTKPLDNVLYGYGFNVTRCEGYMECVQACVKENNLDRKSNTQYIRIFEMEHGQMSPDQGDGKYFHMVPRQGHFYMGVQCFQCENPPCVKACPTKATWKEKDGIVVVDYDWCIGCRYCMAACPYWGRRFNWNQPEIPKEEITTQQHYLGNRPRVRGMMEKCTFCIQRSRKGKMTACVEACPTGARVFGNLLDPDSEIRFVLENKKVYRLKEDLGTDPKFWYFID
jgi:Fe-S-cluster-containing dehydrogenase component